MNLFKKRSWIGTVNETTSMMTPSQLVALGFAPMPISLVSIVANWSIAIATGSGTANGIVMSEPLPENVERNPVGRSFVVRSPVARNPDEMNPGENGGKLKTASRNVGLTMTSYIPGMIAGTSTEIED
jgi:hypothetical protein